MEPEEIKQIVTSIMTDVYDGKIAIEEAIERVMQLHDSYTSPYEKIYKIGGVGYVSAIKNLIENYHGKTVIYCKADSPEMNEKEPAICRGILNYPEINDDKPVVNLGILNRATIQRMIAIVEEKTGEQVIHVCVHKDEIDLDSMELPKSKVLSPIKLEKLEPKSICFYDEPKKESHKRPYKFHK
jgi:hypothetical protein